MTQGTVDIRALAGHCGSVVRRNIAVFVAAVLVQATCAFGSTALTAESQGAALPSYASVRADVSIQQSNPFSADEPRPGEFFQLAGAANQQLCSQMLEAFNEAGQYRGGDMASWLLDSSRQILFRGLTEPAPGSIYDFPSLEYAGVDLSADGTDEHVYRLNSVIKSELRQRLMIVPDELQRSPWLVTRYGEACNKATRDVRCGSITTLIEFAIMARAPDRLATEWQFTKNDPVRTAVSDDASRQLIYAGRNKLRRNLGDSGVRWGLYRLRSGVVAVAAPSTGFDFAPPELLVFVPSATQSGVLQCVLMPVAWHVTQGPD